MKAIRPLTALAVAAIALANPSAHAFTVWNVNVGDASVGNTKQITTTDNYIGAATENTVNSTWNAVSSTTTATLADSTGSTTQGVTFKITPLATGTPTPNIMNFGAGGAGDEIFHTWIKDNGNNDLFQISFSNLPGGVGATYDLVVYSEWHWANSDGVPVNLVTGTGMTGTFFINHGSTRVNGSAITPLLEDTNPANTNTTENTNYARFRGLSPVGGNLTFSMGGVNAGVNGFQLIQTGTGAPDTTPPTPSPMTWASVPAAVGSSSITMTATTATDISGVEYFFDETSGNAGGTDSAWQNSPTYVDAGLSASTTYTYTVTARDKSSAQNPTTASASASATTTAPDSTPPTPSPMTWSSVPAPASSSSITMTATTATDASGVDYFFDETSGNLGGTDSGWQSSPTYTDTGLSPSTSYTYTVTARDRSAALNATAASAPTSATTSAAPLYTVWNVQFASSSGNQITTADNFIGAATENTANSTWNRVASLPQTGMVLKKSTSENTSITLDFSGGSIGTQNLLNGSKIFNSRVGGGSTSTLTLKGLTIANSYDIVIYSDWWWKNGDALPITQTSGSGLTGTFFINRVQTGTNGEVLALTRDTNPADITSGAGNTGNWMRVNGLTPTLAGELAFRLTDGNNTPFNGFQLIATPLAPKADMLFLSLASNPPSIRDAVISGTNVTLTVPFGTNVTNLAPTYTLWPGATCPTSSGTPRNFTTPQTYTVTSSDSLVVKNYVVTVVIAPPLPEFILTAPANWDGRSTITAQPVISNLALLQANNGTNFTYNWSTSGVAVTQTTSPSIMTLTRSQGSGPLLVTLTMNNGTENVTASTTISIQEPSTDPWVERTPLANEKPIDNQFFARNPFTNLGTIFYRGTQNGSPNSVFLKVYKTPSGGSETLDATYTQSLVGGAYDFTAPIQAGLFTYRVVYGTTTGVTVTDVATVNNLLCGDAYIIEGQSNAQATDTGTTQVDTSAPWVKTYDASLGWGPAYARPTSPNWGSKVGFWGFKLAQDIVAQHSMPVCLINGAVGGTYIAQHQPNPANHTVGAGTYDIYANLLNRVIAARLTHGIRGVFWHQGESDAASFGPPLEPDYLSYEQNFLSMSSAWKQDYPNFQRYVVFQIAPNPCGIGPFASEIREVQRQLPRLYSKMSLVNSIAVPGYEGCHYTPAGYQSLASRVLPVVKRDFYGVTYSEAVTPPNLVRAYFTSSARTAIALQFDQLMSWSSFSLPNWYVNDVANQVTSGSASGNTITLQLTSAAAANSTLDYVKDTWNYTESVSTLLYGANTVPALMPALTFANVAIGALAPYESWTTSKNLSGPAADGDADPDNDSVKNAIEFVLGGEPNPANPGSNSTALLPTSTRNGAGDLIFTFKRKLASVGGVSLNFQWSNNLAFPALNTVPINATSSTTDGITVAISVFDAATDNITITVPASKAAGGKLFGRLNAVAP